MISSIRPLSHFDTIDLVPEMHAALSQLARAADYSAELECDCWEFSVEIDRLLALGLTTSDLRWLVKRGYASHAREITLSQDSARRFEAPEGNLAFCKTTCLIVTEEGLHKLRDESDSGCAVPEASYQIVERRELALSATDSLEKAGHASVLPSWDRESRILQVGEQIIKRFRVPSPNQESVLEAFHEEGWPHSIDDPLSPVPDQQPKRRLRDTIKCLNLNQAVRRIRFRGDGTGQRVLWELVQQPAAVILPAAAVEAPPRRTQRQSLRRAA